MRLLDGLRGEIEGLQRLDVAALVDDELGGLLVELQELKDRLANAESQLVVEFDARRAYTVDGSRTAAGWLARHANRDIKSCRRVVRFARGLACTPLVAEALAAGEISVDHAELLVRLASIERIAEAYERDQQTLVEQAKGMEFDRFQLVVRYWETNADEDGADQDSRDDHDVRHLHASRIWGGNVRIDGQLDAIAGSVFLTELDRLERQLFDHDWAAARAVHGDDTRVEHLARTPAQRRADALTMMSRRSATPGDGEEPRPLFVVHVGYPDPFIKLCETWDRTVMTPGQLAPLLIEADIERIVYGPRSRKIIDLGRKSRLFTGALRRAIQLRDRHCQHPGCRIPAEHCDIDHVVPWTAHGETSQTNGQARCGHHNRHKGTTLPNDPDP